MKQKNPIQFKALFLLIIFSLNMLIGFACAVGVDMSFKNANHNKTDAVQIHTHLNGEKHEHHKKVNQHREKEKNTGIKEKEGCCNDTVVKISQAEKAVPKFNTIIHPIFFTSFIAIYFNLNNFYPSQIVENFRYFLQNYHPPITDIRIAIKSFQI